MAGYKWQTDRMNWGAGADPNRAVEPVARNQYYQHFYSGSDAFFFIVNSEGKLVPMPVVNFGYGVSQEKVPVYGAWDYKYRFVARGTRIVRGEFTIVFTRPNWLGDMIMDQSKPDYEDRTDPLITVAGSKEISERESLRAAIWGDAPEDSLNVSDNVSVYTPQKVRGNQSAFPFGRDPQNGDPAAAYAGHPAFDIMISHGNNPDYGFDDPNNFSMEAWTSSIYDHLKYFQGSVNDATGTQLRRSERLYIKSVELMSSGIAYDTSGQPLAESYSFIAQEVIAPVVT